MTTFKFKVEGLAELDGALKALAETTSTPTAKATLKRAMVKAMEPMAERARQLVPVRSGGLKRSIVVSAKVDNSIGKAEYHQALKSGQSQGDAVAALRAARREAGGGSQLTVAMGPGRQPHAHLVEFGSVHNAPHPYMRPAFDQCKEQVINELKGQLAAEIAKTAARAARRAAKRAGG